MLFKIKIIFWAFCKRKKNAYQKKEKFYIVEIETKKKCFSKIKQNFKMKKKKNPQQYCNNSQKIVL